MIDVMATEAERHNNGGPIRHVYCVQIIINGLIFERDCSTLQTAQRLADEVRREIKAAR